MLWICRTGKNSMYHDMFLQNQKIYLPWELFNINLSAYKTYSDIKVIIPEEIKTNNLNSVANTSNQLDYFCNVMKIDDYVLIPKINDIDKIIINIYLTAKPDVFSTKIFARNSQKCIGRWYVVWYYNSRNQN